MCAVQALILRGLLVSTAALPFGLQSGGLQIASGIPHGAALLAEMADMRAKVTAAGNTQFGAWREGSHDDLVLAVALACWGARRMYPQGPDGAEAYWRRTGGTGSVGFRSGRRGG
jgi:hypothetical protein